MSEQKLLLTITIDENGNIVTRAENEGGKSDLRAEELAKAIGGKVESKVTKPAERHNVARVQRTGA